MCIPDNYDLWVAHDRQQEAELKKLPVCEKCGQPIQSEDLYDIEGDLYCEECGDRLFKRYTENYIREE